MEGAQKKRVILGKSILVPSVIEVAKTSLVKVPDEYICCNQNNNYESSDNCLSEVQLPVINMQGLISRDELELQKLDYACKEWGFFQLVNHGVSSSLIEKFKVETREFFNLPLEEKKKYWQTPTDIEGYGQAFVVSEEQKLDWADMFYLTTLPKYQRKPNLLPTLPLPFRETLENYSTELQNLAMNIIDCMAIALNIDVEEMRDMFGEGSQSIRMNYYPPCPQPDKVIGLSPHSDAISALTILLHIDQDEGLQIRKDGKWISIKPLPNAFTINIGDVLEIVTNGIYRSILHRATVNASKERLSVATFCTATNDREIGPFPSLTTANSPAKFRKIGMVDYWKGFLAKSLDGTFYLDTMRIYEK